MNTDVRGLNRRIHGGFRAISEQAKEKSYTPKNAKHDIKWLATAEGYPTKKRKVKFHGKIVEWVEPVSMKGISTELGMIIWMTIEIFANEHNLYLYEYNENDEPYRTIGGRTQAEMEGLITELEKIGNFELARKLRQKPRWYKKEQSQSEMFEDNEMGVHPDIF